MDEQAIVFNLSVDQCGVGLAGMDHPQHLIPSTVSRLRDAQNEERFRRKFFFGAPTTVDRRAYTQTRPMQHGAPNHWDDFEAVWDHTFEQLHVNPRVSPVQISESPAISDADRAKILEIMFENFHSPAVNLTNQALLSLYCSGRTTGVILQVDEDVCFSVAAYEGTIIRHATTCVEVGGWDISNYLQRLLAERGQSFATTAERDAIHDLRRRTAYVALNLEEELQLPHLNDPTYLLPDGQEIIVGEERFRCTEALFHPQLLGKMTPGIHNALHESITKAGNGLERQLLPNVVLAGGTSMIDGIADRLLQEMQLEGYASMRKKLIAPPDRAISSWIGGSILASLTVFPDLCVTTAEYEEIGPAVTRKFV